MQIRAPRLFYSGPPNPPRWQHLSRAPHRPSRQFATVGSPKVPHLVAREMKDSNRRPHIHDVHHHLQTHGILKISLAFPDNDSQYLESLITSLGTNHGHGPPITHSASRGWFWDVRPNSTCSTATTTTTTTTENHRARSETMREFPWHTDCSYEHAPPQFFALQVLQPDRYGGGTLSIMKIAQLAHFLSPAAKAALFSPEFQIQIPPEFVKDPSQQHIRGSLLSSHPRDGSLIVRLREDIITPVNPRAAAALRELRIALQELEFSSQATLHLTPAHLPERSIILLDNQRWLHARTNVTDPARHLRRVRWNAIPFPSQIYDDHTGVAGKKRSNMGFC